MSYTDSGVLAEVARELEEVFGLFKCIVHARLAGGISGSGAFLVHYVPKPGAPLHLGVAKITSREEDFVRESTRHSLALNSWMRSAACDLARQGQRNKRFFLLGDLALRANEQFRNATLHDLVAGEGSGEAVRCVVSNVAQFYSSGLRETLLQRAEWAADSVAANVQHTLRFWGERLASADWEWWNFPRCESPRFMDGDTVYVNPLWAALDGDAWKPESIPFPVGLQHCDLNLRNIVVEPSMGEQEGGNSFRIIDWEKLDRASMHLDLCWAALWALMASAHGKERVESSCWERVPRAFVDAVTAGGNPAGLGSFETGVDVAAAMFSRVREELADVLPQPRSLEASLLLTLGAAALAKSFYEVRDLSRSRAAGGGVMHAAKLRWAVLFFRIAAIAWKRSGLLTDVDSLGGDLRFTDATGLGEPSDLAIVERVSLSCGSVDDVLRLRSLAEKGHALARAAVVSVQRKLPADRTMLAEVAARVPRLMDEGITGGEAAEWLLSLSCLEQPESLRHLSPREQLELISCTLQIANRAGLPPADFRFASMLAELHDPAFDLPAQNLFRADLLQAAAYENVMEFGAAMELLKSRWPEESSEFRSLGPTRNGQYFSTLGRNEAFLGNHAAADALFCRGLDAFGRLAAGDVRRRLEIKTATYRVLNLMGCDLHNAKTLLSDLCVMAFDHKLEDAGPWLAASGRTEAAYVHHAYLRFAYECRGEGWSEPYVERRDLWTTHSSHPWELIDLYRGLLLSEEDPSGAAARLRRAGEWPLFEKGMLRVIGLVICGVGVCLGLVGDERLIERCLGCAVRLERVSAIKFSFAAARKCFEEPNRSRVPELLRLLPFNYR